MAFTKLIQQDRKNLVVALAKQGLTHREIQARTGIPRSSVSNILVDNKMGRKRGRKKGSPGNKVRTPLATSPPPPKKPPHPVYAKSWGPIYIPDTDED